MAKKKDQKQKYVAMERRRKRERDRLRKAIERQLVEAKLKPATQVKDEPTAQIPTPVPEGKTPAQDGTHTDVFDELWEDFEEADLEGKFRLYTQALDLGVTDDELVYEMVSTIHRLVDDDPSSRARIENALNLLRQKSPELYRKDAPYYNDILITHAILDGRSDAIPELLAPFMDPAHLDAFVLVKEKLQYHGLVKYLVRMMRAAWPRVQESPDLFEWAIEEFGGDLMEFILEEYLQTSPSPDASDPALLEATSPYGKWKPGWLERFIPRLSAKAPSPWKIADFGTQVDSDQWLENMENLLAEFVADRARHGVPYSRGRLAWERLSTILEEQFLTGSLPGQEKNRIGKKGKGGQPSARGLQLHSPLVPERERLDRCLAESFSLFGAHPYPVAAVIALLPAYLLFLARLGILHPVEMEKALENLRPFAEQAIPVLKDFGVDSLALKAVRDAWNSQILEIHNDPALVEARSRPVQASSSAPPLPARRPGSSAAYLFKITYLRNPNVWRTIEMAGHQTLDDLHRAIQVAVSFDNDHLYSFYMSNRAWDKRSQYSDPRSGQGLSAAKIKIGELNLRMKQRFLYLFDFGDEHRFEVQLIGVNEFTREGKYPRIIDRHGKDPVQYSEFEDDED